MVVSDNASDNWDVAQLEDDLIQGIRVEKRNCNLSAGANFLRAFERTCTEWVHVMGDDDILSANYLSIIQGHISNCPEDISAIKFDTGLYGRLKTASHNNLLTATSDIRGDSLSDWFNNLLLISGWLFRREQTCRHLRSAYLGYGTKLSHILPTLSCCEKEGRLILFSSDMPIVHGPNLDNWPKAPTWTEMCLNTQLSQGYVSETNREALYRCLFMGSIVRLVVKVLRIRAYYQRPSTSVHWLRILVVLSGISTRFLIVTIATLPLLLVPPRIWPSRLCRILGSEGSFDRW